MATTGARRARAGLACRLRDDDGQMMAPFVLFLGVTILAFTVSILVPVGAATNERSRSQTAADAAALAGAEQLRTDWVFRITAPTLLTMQIPPVHSTDGRASATTYAQSNGSRVIQYGFDDVDSVYAKVESNTAAFPGRNPSSRPRAQAESTVEMDVDFTGCRWSAPPEPPPPPAGTGPPVFERTLTCGDWSASYVVTNVPGSWPTASYVGTTPRKLFQDLEPRIVS